MFSWFALPCSWGCYLDNARRVWCRSFAVLDRMPHGHDTGCRRWCCRSRTRDCHYGHYIRCCTCSWTHTWINIIESVYSVNMHSNKDSLTPVEIKYTRLKRIWKSESKWKWSTLYTVYTIKCKKVSTSVCVCVWEGDSVSERTNSTSSESSSHSAPNLQFPHFEAFLLWPDPSSSCNTTKQKGYTSMTWLSFNNLCFVFFTFTELFVNFHMTIGDLRGKFTVQPAHSKVHT